MKVLREVLHLLIEEKEQINNPDLEKVMKALSRITGIELMEEVKEEKPVLEKLHISKPVPQLRDYEAKKVMHSLEDNKSIIDFNMAMFSYKYKEPDLLWQIIFELI